MWVYSLYSKLNLQKRTEARTHTYTRTKLHSYTDTDINTHTCECAHRQTLIFLVYKQNDSLSSRINKSWHSLWICIRHMSGTDYIELTQFFLANTDIWCISIMHKKIATQRDRCLVGGMVSLNLYYCLKIMADTHVCCLSHQLNTAIWFYNLNIAFIFPDINFSGNIWEQI